MLYTYAPFGAAWLWNETSPLGWWILKLRLWYGRLCPLVYFLEKAESIIRDETSPLFGAAWF
jgi:hypothetical protein